MANEIRMPKLSDTMEEGTVLSWKIKPGDAIAQGDVIAEVETDKAAMEMEAFEAGTVESIEVEEGKTVPVGTVLAVLKGAGKEAEAEKAEAEKAEAEKAEAEKAEAEKAEAEKAEAEKAEAEKAEAEKAEAEKAEAEKAEAEKAERERRPVSPAARQLAQEAGIDIRQLSGSGPGGRVVREDVEQALAHAESKPAAEKKAAQAVAAGQDERGKAVRRTVARVTTHSWQTIPHFFVTVVVDVTEIERVRRKLDLRFTDFVLAAAGRALARHPEVNAWWTDDGAQPQREVNVGLAVATDHGLYNPVIRHCDRRNLREIHESAQQLTEQARHGRVGVGDLQDASFAVSNLGMMGVEAFTAIITPPQVAALAVGAVAEEVVRRDGRLAYLSRVRLTLSADHRALDGAEAATFLGTLRELLEAPLLLLD